jgi:protein subunit release factor B
VKEKLFSIPPEDLHWDFFRSGGKGGQNVNKRSTAARVTHGPSGAVGESSEERSQHQNRVKALHKMTESKKFVVWCKIQVALKAEGFRSLEEKVDKMLSQQNLKIEVGVDAKSNDILVEGTDATNS